MRFYAIVRHLIVHEVVEASEPPTFANMNGVRVIDVTDLAPRPVVGQTYDPQSGEFGPVKEFYELSVDKHVVSADGVDSALLTVKAVNVLGQQIDTGTDVPITASDGRSFNVTLTSGQGTRQLKDDRAITVKLSTEDMRGEPVELTSVFDRNSFATRLSNIEADLAAIKAKVGA